MLVKKAEIHSERGDGDERRVWVVWVRLWWDVMSEMYVCVRKVRVGNGRYICREEGGGFWIG